MSEPTTPLMQQYHAIKARYPHALLLKVNMGAGHGGASGRYDYLREIALDYAFLLTQLGIKE